MDQEQEEAARTSARSRKSPPQSRVRTLPYQQRRRSPAHQAPALSGRSRAAPSSVSRVHRSPSPPVPRRAPPPPSSTAESSLGPAQQFQLVVQPIVKSTVAQRDSSGETLDNFVANGSTFQDIISKLWEKFNGWIKAQAVKRNGEWTAVTPSMAEWRKVMKFKRKRHIVDDTQQSEKSSNSWLASVHGEPITLLIYEYSVSIIRDQDLSSFKEACVIRPELTDRADAAAEDSLLEVVAKLQKQWESSFKAEAVVWRMWANHILRNHNQSTLGQAISDPPPDHITRLLRAPESPLSMLSRSAHLALDCVDSSMEDYRKLRQHYDAFGRLLDDHMRSLLSRKRTIDAFIQDLPQLRDNLDDFERGL
ncbi:hypothetical protein PI125_g20321 [Phytophthora idaei]|nr:hypothetical protein PI125_g20321 [Phytophthora idaei]